MVMISGVTIKQKQNCDNAHAFLFKNITLASISNKNCNNIALKGAIDMALAIIHHNKIS